jgi:hypothetical protein
MTCNCVNCGQFCNPAAWKMVYSGYPKQPDHEIYKCASCFVKYGAFVPQEGIKPEFSCGVFDPISMR